MTSRAHLRGVSKRYGRVRALAGADLEVAAGEVHGLLGENGAGKSTLLRILCGFETPDAGEVRVAGVPVRFRTPRDAWAAGVGLVHQHFTLVPRLTVLENLVLGGRERLSDGRLRLAERRAEALELQQRTGLRVPLDARVEDLGVGSRQRAEILKALLRRPSLLVLDEPTAVLTPGEVTTLFALLRGLAEAGSSVVLVSHKLQEVLGVSDRVTVLRAGLTVLEAEAHAVDEETLAHAMVGQGDADAAALGTVVAATRAPATSGEPVATLTDVHVGGARGESALAGASMTVARGEIVAVAGVEGNGQRELALVLAGRLRPERGAVSVPDRVAFVPQDRTTAGLVGAFDLAENVALALQWDDRFRRGPWLDWPGIRRRTGELAAEYAVVAPDTTTRAEALSGGNQQRLVVARELAGAADLVVAENPTRGLDVAAAAFVHGRLEQLVQPAAGGTPPGVVILSTDLDEVLLLAHRVLVIRGGRLVHVPPEQLTRDGVGRRMLVDRGDARA